MPLEKEKYQKERQKYAMLSSGMFLFGLAMIAGLAYVSYSKAQLAKEKSELIVELENAKEEINELKSWYEDRAEAYENQIDSLYQVSGYKQKQEILEIKSYVNQVTSKKLVTESPKTGRDLEEITNLEMELVQESDDLTDEQVSEKKEKIEEIQNRNPAVKAVIKAQDKLAKMETENVLDMAASSNLERDTRLRSYTTILERSGNNAWIKEGYFRQYKGPQGHLLKIDVLDLKDKNAKVRCSFLNDRNIKPWDMTISEGETKQKALNDGEFIVSFTYVRMGAAGRNPLNKAMYYDLKIMKKG